MRPTRFHRGDKGFDKVIVLLAANTMMAPAEVDWTLQPILIVRSNIEQNRKTVLWMDSAERGVKSHFPIEMPMPPAPWSPSPRIRSPSLTTMHFIHHNGDGSGLFDATFVRIAEKQTSGLSPYLAESLATFAYRWRVDKRQHFFDIANQEGVEERLVRILQVAEKRVFIERSRLIIQCLQAALKLFVERSHMRRQQAVQVKYVALVIGEGCSFVETGRIDQVISREGDLTDVFAGCSL